MLRLLRNLLATLAITLTIAACNEHSDLLGPCDDCIGQCSLPTGFDFEGYDKSCGQGPSFCLSAYDEGSSCTEPDFELEESTIAELHQALKEGAISCEWVVARHLERALQYDLQITAQKPPFNSFIALNEAALATARQLDDFQRCEGILSGPLHCVPFTIKGNFASKELPTTAGSLSLGEAQAHEDAFIVDQMRRAGAVMIGTASMDEFARGQAGHSSRSGKIGNAYDPSRISGGSSGGSAVGVSANFAMASLGTDNCGSLLLPAAYNGLITLRPTLGLISTEGIFPLNRLNGTAGPMTRTVDDLATMLDVLVTRNPADQAHCEEAPKRPESYQDHLNPQGLKGKRIGVLRTLTDEATGRRRHPFSGANEQTLKHYDRFFEELRQAGAQIIDPVELPEVEDKLYSTRAGYDIDRFLEHTTGPIKDVQDLCRSKGYAIRIYEDVQDCLNKLTQSARDVSRRLERGGRAYGENRAYVERVLDELELDALVYPADPRGGPRTSSFGANCVLSSYTGLPSITVAAAPNAQAMPVGMIFTGRAYSEPTLIELAKAYEHNTSHRAPPNLPANDHPPSLSIPQFNALHLAIGEASFDQILASKPDRWALSAAVFSQIAQEEIRKAGHPQLIQP